MDLMARFNTYIVAEIGCPAEWADAMAEASPAPAPGMPAKPVETDFLVLLLLLFFVLELAFLVEEEAAGLRLSQKSGQSHEVLVNLHCGRNGVTGGMSRGNGRSFTSASTGHTSKAS
jgi:hypothetical protein